MAVSVDHHAAEMHSCMEKMKDAVRAGEFIEARDLGMAAPVPLGLTFHELAPGDLISEGAQSKVFDGSYKGGKVAIKKSRIGGDRDLEFFRKELAVMARLQHPHLVPLVGARLLPPDYFLVMPRLHSTLEKELYVAGWRPGMGEVLRIAKQMAEGIQHLHAHGLVHRDIKPANVLVDSSGDVCVTDFGLAEEAEVLRGGRKELSGPTGGFHKLHMVGTLEYMPPEVLSKKPHTEASDIYAWAVTVNELATGTFPFSDCTADNPHAHTVLEMGYGQMELLAAIAVDGLRPILPLEGAPAAYCALMERCWSVDPEQRPTGVEVLAALEGIITAGGGGGEGRILSGPAVEEAAPAGEVASIAKGGAADGSLAAPAWGAGAAGEGVYAPAVRAGVFETCGNRGADRMEDTSLLAPEFGGLPNAHLFGVFDGHRGKETADFAKAHMAAHVGAHWAAAAMEEVLGRAFVGVDAAFRGGMEAEHKAKVARMGGAAGPPKYPGCTAVAALVYGNRMAVANAGDCRAVLCRGGKPVALSRDHNAESPDERARIQAAGGVVEWKVDSWRIGAVGMQVTRSLGDGDLKKDGLTAEPEVITVDLAPGDEFLVMGSDGLFDMLSNEDVVGLVHDTVKEPGMCAQRLVTEAITRGSGDNITALVVFLGEGGTHEKIFSGGKAAYEFTGTHYSSRSHKSCHEVAKIAINEINDSY